jgi:hypothetical protein
MAATIEEFAAFFVRAQRSAVHLEMRDGYMPSDPAFIAWKAGTPLEDREIVRIWHDLIGKAVARGVVVRRARIISEPVTDYIAWEHSVTASTNIAAGEQVRWLPRRQASDLALPGNDFWLLDDDVVMWNHFTGDGESAGKEVTEDPAAAKLCSSAFEAVWERGIDHERYQLAWSP